MTRDRWGVALEEYERALRERGYYSAQTMTKLLTRIRRFSKECGLASPWQVTPGRIERWLDGLGVSVRETYACRQALRTFYRWATEAGRITVDPTEGLWGRRQELVAAPAWMVAVGGFVSFLRASGASAGTIRHRRYQIITLGRTVGVVDPWRVSEDALVEWFGTRGWDKATLRNARGAVRLFYGWAVSVGHVDHDPSRVLPKVSDPPPNPRPAPDAAVLEAIAAADARTGLLVRLQAELGLRISEAAKVHTSDLQQTPEGWWLYVTGKGAKTRALPLGDDLAAVLRDREPGYVFPGQVDGHLSTGYAGKLVSDVLPPGVTPHKLRHRFATVAYGQTRDVLAVQQLLGHNSPTTTQRYVAVPADNLRRLVMGSQIGGR